MNLNFHDSEIVKVEVVTCNGNDLKQRIFTTESLFKRKKVRIPALIGSGVNFKLHLVF